MVGHHQTTWALVYEKMIEPNRSFCGEPRWRTNRMVIIPLLPSKPGDLGMYPLVN